MKSSPSQTPFWESVARGVPGGWSEGERYCPSHLDKFGVACLKAYLYDLEKITHEL